MDRRQFLYAGAGLATWSSPLWGDFADPLFLTAGNLPDNSTWLVGLTQSGEVRFKVPLPGRGHAAATHPDRAEAVAFARRPGAFAIVLSVTTGHEIARLATPEGSHFYGHGAFTADGRYLFTTENAYDIPDGRIGVWDAENGYRRVGDFASGGIGPHEIIRLPDGGFAVANGGIQTHPDFARAKLNLPTMETNLTFLAETGSITGQSVFADDMRQNSIRHIDADRTGNVVAALQWQGAPQQAVPLVARFRIGLKPQFLAHPATGQLKHYAGSIAVSPDGDEIAVTGPKGNHVLFLDGKGKATFDAKLGSAAGVAKADDGLVITCTGGLAVRWRGVLKRVPVAGNWSWDNHLVRVA